VKGHTVAPIKVMVWSIIAAGASATVVGAGIASWPPPTVHSGVDADHRPAGRPDPISTAKLPAPDAEPTPSTASDQRLVERSLRRGWDRSRSPD
jgi:hypothetical protein